MHRRVRSCRYESASPRGLRWPRTTPSARAQTNGGGEDWRKFIGEEPAEGQGAPLEHPVRDMFY